MLGTMSEKKPKRGRPKGRQTTVVVQARVSPEMHAALEKLAERNRRTKNTEMIIALEKHLQEAGLWGQQETGGEE
jgi:hypothetical protein